MPVQTRSDRRPFCFLFLMAALLVPTACAQPADRTLDLVPGDAIATITLRDGAGQIAALRESAWLNRILESEAFDTLRSDPNFLKAQGALYMAAGMAGLDPWKLVGQAFGREATVALLPDPAGRGPVALVIIEPQDTAVARRLLQAALELSGATAGGKPAVDRSRELGDARAFRLAPTLWVAEIGDRVVFASDGERLARLPAPGAGSAGVRAAERFAAATRHVPAEAIAWAFVDLRSLREKNPPQDDGRLDNALGGVLLGALTAVAQRADAGVVWIAPERGALTIRGRLIGGPADGDLIELFQPVSADARDWNQLELPGLISNLTFSRDWTGLWDARDQLLNEKGLRGLAEFAGTLTTLMGSFDFSSELLPGLNPSLQFLAARQQFDGTAPTPELPGFALLLHLRDAEKLGPRFESAMLALVGFLNIDAGQKMQPQYQLGIDQHRNVRVLSARFPRQLDAGPPGFRHNFEPCFASVEDRFVVATSRRLLCDLIDAVEKLPTAGDVARSRAADVLEVDLRELGRLLIANQELLIANRMLSEDLPRETAAAQIGLLLEAGRLLDRVRIELSPVRDGYELAATLGLADEKPASSAPATAPKSATTDDTKPAK